MIKMKPGAFCFSLTAKDISASRTSHENLELQQADGNATQNRLIPWNAETTIGSFDGTFERNTLAFNPDCTNQATPLREHTDGREIQTSLKARGLALAVEADETTTGQARLMLIDPDENPVLINRDVNRVP